MKTPSIFSLLLLFSLVLTSCKKEGATNENTVGTELLTTVHTDSIPINNDTQQTLDSESSKEVKLNPPHGQPGHRCDIAVGAPLNTPVNPGSFYQQPVIPKATQTAAPVSNQVTTPNTPRPKLNPAHGQPHHDCKIKVGDPLPDA